MTGKKGRVTVAAATIWTDKNSPRELDEKAVSNPADLDGWLNELTHETRLALCDENRIQTQALFGEEVLILEEEDGFAHVIVPSQASSKDDRGYPGWMPLAQIAAGEEESTGPIAVVQSKKTMLFSKEKSPLFELSFQTILPVEKEDTDWISVNTPLGTCLLKAEDVSISGSFDEIPKGNGADIVKDGERFLGLPYLWGGMSSFGFDCSGFSYTMCKANGYIIPRDAHDQAASGEKVELHQLEPGDLLFFAYEEGKGSLHHVGIYYGDGKLLHSPNTGKTIEILEMAGTIYEKELCAARRYFQKTEG